MRRWRAISFVSCLQEHLGAVTHLCDRCVGRTINNDAAAMRLPVLLSVQSTNGNADPKPPKLEGARVWPDRQGKPQLHKQASAMRVGRSQQQGSAESPKANKCIRSIKKRTVLISVRCQEPG